MGSLKDADIRHALKVARDNGYRHVRLKSDDSKFDAVLAASRTDQSATHVSVTQAAAAIDVIVDTRHFVLSPVVGYAQLGTQNLSLGDEVSKGQVMGEVVALGLANEVLCNTNGVVTEILFRPGEPVEFGQPLFALEENL